LITRVVFAAEVSSWTTFHEIALPASHQLTPIIAGFMYLPLRRENVIRDAEEDETRVL
jgi:hypothetical protein